MSRVEDDGHEHDLVMPGFRFHPTEEELIDFYLRRKVEGRRFNVELIAFLDLYRHDPWELPALAAVGEKEWFFYVPRDRKYRNGDRPNRVTRSGYWKATGAGRAVRAESSRSAIGVKKTLVFYSGKAPKGIRTSWIMNEYRLPQSEVERNHKADISLCRVYNRAGVEDCHQLPGTVPYKHGLHRSNNSHQRTPAGFQSTSSIINVDDAASSPILQDELRIRAETNTPTSSSSLVAIPVPAAALYRCTTSATTSLSPATSTDQEDISTPLLHQPKNASDLLIPITTTTPYPNFGHAAASLVGTAAAPAFDELCRLANVNQQMMSCVSQQPASHFLIQMPSSVQPQHLLPLDATTTSVFSEAPWEWNPQFPDVAGGLQYLPALSHH